VPDKAGSPARDASLDDRVRMFERLASEVARLNFYTARGKVGGTLHFFSAFGGNPFLAVPPPLLWRPILHGRRGSTGGEPKPL
jgi:hypothetical protein